MWWLVCVLQVYANDFLACWDTKLVSISYAVHPAEREPTKAIDISKLNPAEEKQTKLKWLVLTCRVAYQLTLSGLFQDCFAYQLT